MMMLTGSASGHHLFSVEMNGPIRNAQRKIEKRGKGLPPGPHSSILAVKRPPDVTIPVGSVIALGWTRLESEPDPC